MFLKNWVFRYILVVFPLHSVVFPLQKIERFPYKDCYLSVVFLQYSKALLMKTEQSSGQFIINVPGQSTETLQGGEEMYRLLIERSHDIIYSISAAGIFTYVSPVWTELLGHPVNEVIGKSFKGFVHIDDLPACLVWLQNVIESGKRAEGIEYRVRHKDGRWFLHTSSAVPFMDETNTFAGYYGIAADITERRRALEEKIAMEQMHLLAKHTEKARESERESISRDLHDDLGQSLTAIKIHLGFIKQSVSGTEIAAKVDKVTSMVSDTITSVRRITAKLRPEIFDDLGLEASIQFYTKEFAERNGVEITLTIHPHLAMPIDSSLIIFRIIQESLTNISRHAKATRVYIALNKTDDSIILRISDNGAGIKKAEIESKTSWGIISMKERAHSLGGSFEIYSENGQGTVIKVVIPDNSIVNI
jgi:PAS domain S-box-containing protein